jgi:phage baseplate assembly protein W
MADDVFSGRGWAFPVRAGLDGSILATSSSDETIRNAIWMILSTAPGERVMRPEFGCAVDDLVFGINDASTAGEVSQAVWTALSELEPRIDVLDVQTVPDPQDPRRLLVEIAFEIRASNSRLNLVYPFYLE